jgi:hypothetical protein
MSEDLLKKRGRPKKNINEKKQVDKNINVEMETYRELILHLPIIEKKESKNDKLDSLINYTEKNDNILSSETESSEDLLSEVRKRDKIIKETQKQLQHYKTIVSNFNISTQNLVSYPLDLKLIDMNTGKSVITDRTNISCWHDTEKFDTIPFFIPDRYDRGKYYVFGCFCSMNCGLSYILNMNDYRKNDRYSLFLNMYDFLITNKDEEILPSPPKEILDKFSGANGISIEEYRKNLHFCTTKYKFLMPPCIPITTYIEESRKKLNL